LRKKCSDDEIISLWGKYRSATVLSGILKTNVRNVHARRRSLEQAFGIALDAKPYNNLSKPRSHVPDQRRTSTIRDGWVIVFFTSGFTDHGYYAVVSKTQAGEASIYNFN
jgi:hypothetical protein